MATGKRERILDSALSVFARKGFYNSKVSEIASAAGVADGTIYLYFKSKDDLLISLFESRMEWLIQRLEADISQVDDTLEKLRHYVHAHLRLALENPELAEFLTVELRQSAKFVREYENPTFGAYLRVLRNLVVRGQEEGRIRPDVAPWLVSRVIFGALDELLLMGSLSQRVTDEVIEEWGTQVNLIFFDGLSVDPASAAPSTGL